MSFLPLGQQTNYISEYSPDLLYPIARIDKWSEMGIESERLPFFGEDIWNAYEVSWLDLKGKPIVAIAEFRFPYNSPNIVESKSFKLYLNSLNQTRYGSEKDVINTLKHDLSKAAGTDVEVTLQDLNSMQTLVTQTAAYCIDDLEIETSTYHPDANLLSLQKSTVEEKAAFVEETLVEEQLVSHLLKSNCPVTNQPDWGSIFIEYKGKQINHESLLAYLISFREHTDFHEQCVERIFIDIMRQCQPDELTVNARYVRRGGLDINPYRSTTPQRVSNNRLSRQ